MCNIWQIPKKMADLPLSAWTDLLSSRELSSLRELDITGGEPFIHPELEELLTWIAVSKTTFLPRLKTLALTTNGILTKRILAMTERVVVLLQPHGVDLVLACGLDAVGPVHDKIRNYPGAWDKLEETLMGLKQIRETHPNLILGIKTTIIPDNVNELDQITAFARAHELFTIISPRIITANRFGNVALQENLNFSKTDMMKLETFYFEMDHAWSGHRRTLLDFFKTGKVSKPCSAGFNTLFVRHNGEVFSCPVIAKPLGNIKQDSLKIMRESSEAACFRKKSGTFTECMTCTEPGLERIAWPFEGFSCLRSLIRMGFSDFSRLIKHMGLDKYL
jgi:MoaA/NifB/PqqE/SkfB family radical SAM enzyme